MNRGEMLVPEGWAVRRGSHVSIMATKDDPNPPPGRWFVLDKAPDGWWLVARDDVSRAWALAHPKRVTSGCIELPGRRLIPPGYLPRPPAARR